MKSLGVTREFFEPYLSPMDRLRLELDEEWKHGASLLDLGDGKMFCGLFRVLSGGVLAHEDKLERDHHRELPERLNYTAQLAANIYLNVPDQGGNILSWNKSLGDHEYDELRGDSYGIEPKLLGPESSSIKPCTGDLIFFNPRKPHAITPSKGGERVTISTFILYGGSKKPLYFWS